MSNLKATQVNRHCSLIWELRLYKIKLDHNIANAAKSFCVKGDGAVDNQVIQEIFNQVIQEILCRFQDPEWSGKLW